MIKRGKRNVLVGTIIWISWKIVVNVQVEGGKLQIYNSRRHNLNRWFGKLSGFHFTLKKVKCSYI